MRRLFGHGTVVLEYHAIPVTQHTALRVLENNIETRRRAEMNVRDALPIARILPQCGFQGSEQYPRGRIRALKACMSKDKGVVQVPSHDGRCFAPVVVRG